MENWDAIVAGGGIGGLAVGYGLARNGHKVCILEARSEVKPSKRGLTLQPNGLEALERLGLLEDAFRIGVKTSLVEWFEIGGRSLVRLDYSLLDHPHNYLLTVIPSEVESVFRQELLKAGGTVYSGTRFVGMNRSNGQVRVLAQREDSQVELVGKLLVGADGENSTVRRFLRLATRIKEYEDHFIFMLVGRADSFQQKAKQYVAKGSMVGFFPTHNSTYIFYYVPRAKVERLKRKGLESFVQELRSIEPEASQALMSLSSWEDTAYAAPKRVDVASWILDGVALMGDAVHSLNPSIAQGANLTLQDAATLVDVLQRCFKSGDFSAAALKVYENVRRPMSKFIQDQAERTARVIDTENRFYAKLARRMLRKMSNDSQLMKLGLRSSAGLLNSLSLHDRLRFLL